MSIRSQKSTNSLGGSSNEHISLRTDSQTVLTSNNIPTTNDMKLQTVYLFFGKSTSTPLLFVILSSVASSDLFSNPSNPKASLPHNHRIPPKFQNPTMGTILIALLMALWPLSNSQDFQTFKAQCDSDETEVQLQCMKMRNPGNIPPGPHHWLHVDDEYVYWWKCKHSHHNNVKTKPEVWMTDDIHESPTGPCRTQLELKDDGRPILHPNMVCQVNQATCPYMKAFETAKDKSEREAKEQSRIVTKILTAAEQKKDEEIKKKTEEIAKMESDGKNSQKDAVQILNKGLKTMNQQRDGIKETKRDALTDIDQEKDVISEALKLWAENRRTTEAKRENDRKVLQMAAEKDEARKGPIDEQQKYLLRVDSIMEDQTNNEAKDWIKQMKTLFQKLYGEEEGQRDFKLSNHFRSSRIPPKIPKDPKQLADFMNKLLEEGNSRELWSMVAKFPDGKYYWYWDVIRVWYYKDFDSADKEDKEDKKKTKKKWHEIEHIVDENEIKRRVRQMEDVSGFKLGDIFEIFGVDFENTDEYKSVQPWLGTSLYMLPAIHPHSSVSYARSLDSDNPYRTAGFKFIGDTSIFQNEVRWQEKHTIYPKLSPNEWEYLRDSPLVETWRAVLSERGDLINPEEGVSEANVKDDANINMQSGMTSHILNEKSIYSIMFEKHKLLSINGPSGNMDAMLDIILLFKDRDPFLAWWGTAQYLGNAPDHSCTYIFFIFDALSLISMC